MTVTAPVQVDALGATGAFRAVNRELVTDVAGDDFASISLVPPLYIARSMAALRQADTLPEDARIEMIIRAAGLFGSATLGGLSPREYQYAVSRIGGVPISAIREATAATSARLSKISRNIQRARPAGAVSDWRDPVTRAGHAVWVRRAAVFAVHAAGNHPGPHSLWPEALALGYRVAIRPSRRDPFTPYRLIAAFRAAGFPDDQVMLLPTDHQGADAILRDADLGMVYGGENVVRKYAADPGILLQGPGRSKVLVTAGMDWREHLDTIVGSISYHGGTGCVNATAVFTQRDPAGLAMAIAERLAELPSLPPEDEKAALPVLPAAGAEAVSSYLLAKAAGSTPVLGGDGVAHELGDGSCVLRPAVHVLDSASAPQAGVELPFPCVWVAGWTPEDGIDPLRNSLVLTAITDDMKLAGRLMDEPTIRNLYLGDQCTYWAEPGIPHDGYLAEFLMRSKAVIRG
jgi:hypothetical protein